MSKVQSVQVHGRRWFQRSYGNTYHSALVRVYLEGESVPRELVLPRAYGYGDHYLQRAADELERAGYMPGREHYAHGGAEPAWQYFRAREIPFHYEALDVPRQKDLHA
jgi:hypothetical protein